MIRLVILDFDDTLTDNRMLDYQAFLEPCKRLGLPLLSLKEIASLRKKGYLAKEIMMMFLKRLRKESLIGNFLSARNDFLNSIDSVPYLSLKKDAESLLCFLKNKKIKCMICSAKKHKKIILRFLVRNKIQTYFSGVYSVEDLGFEIQNLNSSNRILIKNSLLHHIIKSKKIEPNEVIFVGNSIEDVTAAVNMRTHFIYFQNQYLEKLVDKKIIRVNNIPSLIKAISAVQDQLV